MIMSRKKFTTIDLYKTYPYKKYTEKPVTNSEVYVKVEDRSTSPKAVTHEEYKDICEAYTDTIKDMLYQGYDVQLPYGLGIFKIVKYKPYRNADTFAIDWNETNKLHGTWNKDNPTDKRFEYHSNDHSFGKVYYLKWENPTTIVKNKRFYKIRMNYTSRKVFANILKENTDILYNFDDI